MNSGLNLNESLPAIVLTMQVAGLTTLLLLVLATPLAWALARMRSPVKVVLEAVLALPLVLPPTVLGFYLLILFNPQGALSQSLARLGIDGGLSFTFSGLVIASLIYSLPFAVQPLINAFEAVPQRLLDAAASLGAAPVDRFASVVLPLSRRAYITAATLVFAHTVGEFGVVLMVGGNIPGSTQMVSMAIFDHVEAMDYASAHALSLLMLVFSLCSLSLVYALNRRLAPRRGLA